MKALQRALERSDGLKNFRFVLVNSHVESKDLQGRELVLKTDQNVLMVLVLVTKVKNSKHFQSVQAYVRVSETGAGTGQQHLKHDQFLKVRRLLQHPEQILSADLAETDL
uniref:(northern house mosquito) hypothetical protein n=1 Tax=Culex pipiens TaxID=7175 RepID=A0A8D8FWH0_CULPI